MKLLKVLMLITKSNWGGAQRYVFDLATHLPKERFLVEVMAGGNGPLIAKLQAAGIVADGSLPVSNKARWGENVRAVFKLYSIIHAKKPDILHLNSSQIGIVGAVSGRLAGVKRIIFTVHGWAFNEDRPLYQKMLLRFFYWLALVLSHETIAVSESARSQTRNWPFVQNKIAVIHNGISKDTGYSKANARLELVRSNGSLKNNIDGVSEGNLIWIGTIAELHHIKGHEYAIRAVEECIRSLKQKDPNKRVIYTLMGEGEERGRLQDLIKELDLNDNVFLLGHVDNAAQYIKAFDIFLLASLSEGLGYVLLEAGAAALPVVATDVGGIPEVVEDMVSGVLVQPKKPRELSHALMFMIEHPTERHAYGAALHERISKEFSLERMIAETEKTYRAN